MCCLAILMICLWNARKEESTSVELAEGSESGTDAVASLNACQFALLKFHLGSEFVGVVSIIAGCEIIVGRCCDRGKLSPMV